MAAGRRPNLGPAHPRLDGIAETRIALLSAQPRLALVKMKFIFGSSQPSLHIGAVPRYKPLSFYVNWVRIGVYYRTRTIVTIAERRICGTSRVLTGRAIGSGGCRLAAAAAARTSLRLGKQRVVDDRESERLPTLNDKEYTRGPVCPPLQVPTPPRQLAQAQCSLYRERRLLNYNAKRRVSGVKSQKRHNQLCSGLAVASTQTSNTRRTPHKTTTVGPSVSGEDGGVRAQGCRGRGGVVVRLLASHQCEPGFLAGALRILSCGNRAGRCHLPAGFLGYFPPPPRPFYPRFTLIGSQDLDVKSLPKSLLSINVKTTDSPIRITSAKSVTPIIHYSKYTGSVRYCVRTHHRPVGPYHTGPHPALYSVHYWPVINQWRAELMLTQTPYSSCKPFPKRCVELLAEGAASLATVRFVFQAGPSNHIWAALNIKVLRADEGDGGKYGAAPECKGGETGDPRENPSTSGIIRHDSHMRLSLVGGEQANRSAQNLTQFRSNRIRLERTSQTQSSDIHKTPYDRVKRCRERKKYMKACERVNVHTPGNVTQRGEGVVYIRTHIQDDLALNLGQTILISVLHGFPKSLQTNAGRLDCLPPTNTNLDFRKWESCRTTLLVGGFSWGSPISPRPCISTLLHFHLIPPSSAVKTSMLRAAQISLPNSTCFKLCSSTAEGEINHYLLHTISLDKKINDYRCGKISDSLWDKLDLKHSNALNNEVLRADEVGTRYGTAPECKSGGNGRDPRENPLTSDVVRHCFPTCENPRATPPGIEPWSPKWEARSRMTAVKMSNSHVTNQEQGASTGENCAQLP
ncbi:hypothetical protein PR048_024377, partial [Dryococelus australis]